MDRANSKYIKPIIFAFTHWFITTVLQTDKLWFDYIDESIKSLIVKGLYLMFLIVAWSYGYNVYKQIKDGNVRYRRAFRLFVLYLMIMLFFLAFLWPGTWVWDDVWTLNSIQWYTSFYPWQNIITGIYYDILLQILPFPGGLILIQTIMISVCVAYTVTEIEDSFKLCFFNNTYADMLLKILPFLLPPVILFNFSGYRAGMCTHLELCMIVTMICSARKQKEWNIKQCCFFAFIVVVVSSWRSESLVYIPFVLAMVLFDNKILREGYKKVLCISLILIGFLGMHKWQSYELGTNDYEVISLLGPCGALVCDADKDVYANELAMINKVVKNDVLLMHPDTNGSDLFFAHHAVRKDYTHEDYRDFLSGMVKLTLHYPKTFFDERWRQYISTTGITGIFDNIPKTAVLFDGENEVNTFFNSKEIKAKYPPFPRIRRRIVHFLCGEDKYGNVIKPIQLLFWNTIVPVAALICALILTVIRADMRRYSLIIIPVICKYILVLLTQPTGTFMYVYSFYLSGYILLIYVILQYIHKKLINGECNVLEK